MTRWLPDESVASALTDRFRQWTDCNARHDIETLSTIFHQDFRYFGAHGEDVDKAGYLSRVPSLNKGGIWIINRASARVGGTCAQLAVWYYARVGQQDVDLSAYTFATGTWVFEDDRWQCLTQHGAVYEPDQQTIDQVSRRLEAIEEGIR